MQVGHSRPARLGSVLGLLLALAGAAGAKEIGTITASEVVSQLNTGSGWVPAALRTHVGVGHAIRTTTGRLAVLVFERFRQGSDDLFVLAPDTELTIEGDDAGPSYALIRASLRRGGVRWIGPGEVLAPPLGALATGTEFIVNRDPASNVAEVIVISGTVEVWNTLIDSDRVSVGAHQRTRVDHAGPRRRRRRSTRASCAGTRRRSTSSAAAAPRRRRPTADCSAARRSPCPTTPRSPGTAETWRAPPARRPSMSRSRWSPTRRCGSTSERAARRGERRAHGIDGRRPPCKKARAAPPARGVEETMDDARWTTRSLTRAATALAFAATLCGGALADDAPPLRIGMAPNYPPLAFKKDGHLQGIEVDFAKRLGGALNRKIEIINTEWEQLPTALEEKKIDMVMSGTSITEARKQKFDFTDSYMTVGQMAIVRASDYAKLRDPAAMDRPKSRVGFVSRTTGEAWARANLKQAKLHGYTNTEEGVAALENDQIDYFIQDAPAVWRVTGNIMNAHPKLKGIYRPLTTEQLAWVVPKDNPQLLAQLNKVLAEWKKDGTLDDVIDDWITVKKTTIEVKPQ